jgi:hypothetical protein
LAASRLTAKTPRAISPSVEVGDETFVVAVVTKPEINPFVKKQRLIKISLSTQTTPKLVRPQDVPNANHDRPVNPALLAAIETEKYVAPNHVAPNHAAQK